MPIVKSNLSLNNNIVIPKASNKTTESKTETTEIKNTNIIQQEPLPHMREFKTPEELQISTIYNNDVKLNRIVNYISGMKWSVTYFSQLLDVGETTRTPDKNIPVTSQQYRRINNFQIVLNSGLDQDAPDNISGNAVINMGISPLKDDVFIATLTGGRQAVFIITLVEMKKYNLHRVFDVEFKLFKFLDDDVDLYNMLLLKTVKELEFNRNHLTENTTPILEVKDIEDRRVLKSKLNEIIKHYLINFVHSKSNVLSLPVTSNSTYTDSMLNDFLLDIIETDDFPEFLRLNRFDIKDEKIHYTIWDALIKRDIGLLKRCDKYIKYEFKNVDMSNDADRLLCYFGNLYRAVKATEDTASIPDNLIDISQFTETYGKPRDYKIEIPVKPIVPEVIPPKEEVEEPKEETIEDNTENLPILDQPVVPTINNDFLGNMFTIKKSKTTKPITPVKPVIKEEIKQEEPVVEEYQFKSDDGEVYVFPIKDKDNCYVFNKSLYYLQYGKLSPIEELVVQYFKKEVINKNKLFTFVNQYYNWSTVEQYYLIPVLILLIKDYLQNTFKDL